VGARGHALPELEREKNYLPQANNQCYKQNELMRQAAREEIPIQLAAHANTLLYVSL